MGNLTEIAKENGAIKTFRGITFTEHELQATVEQVCKPIIEKANAVIDNLDEGDFISTTRLQELTEAINNFKKLIGHDK